MKVRSVILLGLVLGRWREDSWGGRRGRGEVVMRFPEGRVGEGICVKKLEDTLAGKVIPDILKSVHSYLLDYPV